MARRTDGPHEADLRKRFSREGLSPTRWSNDPGATYAPHDHPYRKVLMVSSGSITFTLESTGERIALRAGDRLEVPSHTVHSARVGPDGVVCLEAQAPASVSRGPGQAPARAPRS